MDKKFLTAPCGLDCFNCSLLESNITENVKEATAKHLNVKPEDVVCKGCRSEEGRCKYAHDCATYKCVTGKGSSFCYECSDFPCDFYLPSQKAAHFPHNMKLYNLCRIKLIGLDAWIDEVPQIRKRYYNGDFVQGQGPVLKTE